MKLSKNFSLSEITYSSTAKRLGIENAPKKKHLQNIQNLITKVIQPIRDHIGAIRISSGYRSPVLNRAIGGSTKSQHCKGEALDLQYWENGEMNNKKLYDWIIDNGVEFDQMINEFDYAWIHLSLKEEGKKNRKQVLEAYKDEDGDTKYRYAPDIIIL